MGCLAEERRSIKNKEELQEVYQTLERVVTQQQKQEKYLLSKIHVLEEQLLLLKQARSNTHVKEKFTHKEREYSPLKSTSKRIDSLLEEDNEGYPF